MSFKDGTRKSRSTQIHIEDGQFILSNRKRPVEEPEKVQEELPNAPVEGSDSAPAPKKSAPRKAAVKKSAPAVKKTDTK